MPFTPRLRGRSVGSRALAGGFARVAVVARTVVPALAGGLALAGCVVSDVQPMSIPLAYRLPSKPDLPRTFKCPAISELTVADALADRLLGVRYHESKPLKADVTLASDPAPWIREGVLARIAQNGIRVAPGAPSLKLTLDTLRTSEDIWHRAGYDARIVLDARLLAPSGRVCWHSSIEGRGGNYGYAGSIVNYQETLDAALDDATVRMIDLPEFKDALCACGG